MSNYFGQTYGDPDWGKMKQLDHPVLVANAIKRFPQHTFSQLLNVIMTESHGAANPCAVRDEIAKQLAGPPPMALTDQHVAALERAIRREGFSIQYDTETGEFTLVKADG